MALGGIVPIHWGCESEFLVPCLLSGGDMWQVALLGIFSKEGGNKISL